MAIGHSFPDRVFETSTTIGTGAYALAGPQAGFRSILSALGDGGVGYFVATDDTDWEVFSGTYTSSTNTLSRDTVFASSNGGAAVNWGTGTRNVFAAAPGAILADAYRPGFRAHAEATPTMTVRLEAGRIFTGTGVTLVAAQSSATITAPVTNPRIDRVVVDGVTGAVSVVTGTEAASPSAPAIPSGKVPVARVALAVGQTVIADKHLTDERTPMLSPFAGGTVTSPIAMSGAAINEAFASLASAATVNIGAAGGNAITITGTTTITAFDTVNAGALRRLTFAGALTLTHNATSLILPGGANITTAAGDVAILESQGSGNWRCLVYAKASGQAVVGTLRNAAVLQDQKASGTAAQSLTASAWNTRNITTAVFNAISGASLASNQFTLPAGSYEFTAFVSHYANGGASGLAKTRLRNVTDGATTIIGDQGWVYLGTANITFTCSLEGRFTIAAPKTFELQSYVSSGMAGGVAASSGEVEVYLSALIVQVG